RVQRGQNGQSRTLTGGALARNWRVSCSLTRCRRLNRSVIQKLRSRVAGRPWRAQWRGRFSAALSTAGSIVTTRPPRLPPTGPPCADPFTAGAAPAATARTSYSPIDQGRGRTGGGTAVHAPGRRAGGVE